MTMGELTGRPLSGGCERQESSSGVSIGGEEAGLGGQHPLLRGREGPPAQAGLGRVCRAGWRGLGPEAVSWLGLPGFQP